MATRETSPGFGPRNEEKKSKPIPRELFLLVIAGTVALYGVFNRTTDRQDESPAPAIPAEKTTQECIGYWNPQTGLFVDANGKLLPADMNLDGATGKIVRDQGDFTLGSQGEIIPVYCVIPQN